MAQASNPRLVVEVDERGVLRVFSGCEDLSEFRPLGPADGLRLVPDDLDRAIRLRVVEAAAFVPPNGKFGPSGEHGPMTLAQIFCSGPEPERWFAWALKSIREPWEYALAVHDFAASFMPDLYRLVKDGRLA